MKAIAGAILFFLLIVFSPALTYSAAGSPGREKSLSEEEELRRQAIRRKLDKAEEKKSQKDRPFPKDSALPEERKWEMRGYYKIINLASKDYLENNYYHGARQRLRLDFNFEFNPFLSSRIVYDNEWVAGSLLRTADFKTAKDAPSGSLFNLDKKIVDNQKIFWQTSLYRGYFKYDKGPLTARLGRQRVAWSVARLWETVDFFNPVSPISIEPHERLGVDAFNLEWRGKGPARMEFIYAPESNYKNTSFAGKFSTLIGYYDFSVLGGKFKEDEAVAFTFDGYLGDAGLRGEASYVFSGQGSDFQRFNVGYDYTFANNLYLLVEYLYNGSAAGVSLAGGFDAGSQVATKNEHLAGAQLGYDLNPLLRAENVIIYDPEEESMFIMPTLEYSIFADLDLLVGAQIFLGKNNSEFGDYNNVYYTWLQWYF